MSNCIEVPIPSWSSLIALGQNLSLQGIHLPYHGFPPGLPSPLFPHLTCPSFQMPNMMLHLQQIQLIGIIQAMLKPITDLLGMSLDSILPNILGISLTDMLAGNWAKVEAAIAAAWGRVPGVPNPLYGGFNSPERGALQALEMFISNYMTMAANIIPNLINEVVNLFNANPFNLGLPGLPTIPTLPTMDSIKAIIIGMIPEIPALPGIPAIPVVSWDGVIKYFIQTGESIADFFANLAIPGMEILPKMPALPNPLYPNLKSPNLEINAMLTGFVTNFVTGLLSMVMNFINSTLNGLPGLSFTFPLICVD